MGKKKRERKEQKLAQRPQGARPLPSLQDILNSPMSPQARIVMDRLVLGSGPTEAQLLQFMSESNQLRQEPELADLYFDLDAMSQVSQRVLPRYQAKIERAESKSQAELEEVLDDARIEMIGLLATMEFRREFLARYDRMLRRLLMEADPAKIEAALSVRLMLQEKSIPWGAIALVIQIFADSEAQLVEPVYESEETIALLKETLGEPGTLEEFSARLTDPAQMDEFMRRLESNPEALAQLEAHADSMLDSFEDAIAGGVIALDLFTPEEAGDALTEIFSVRRAMVEKSGTPDEETLRESTDAIIALKLDALGTPERLAEIGKQLETLLEQWESSQNPNAGLLALEVSVLSDTLPSENRFLQAAFRHALDKLGNAMAQVLQSHTALTLSDE